MAGTPLTDSIEALTTYANQTTGASDTNLSDAVYTLAQGYGGGGFDDLKYCIRLRDAFNGLTLTEIDLDLSEFHNLVSMQGMFTSSNIQTVKIRNFDSTATNINLTDMFYYTLNNISRIEFIDCHFSPQNCLEMCLYCGVQEIIGEFDLTNTTNVNAMFSNATRLKEVRFKANTIKIDFIGSTISACSLLSDESLVSIANGLNPNVTGKSILFHTTPKARCSTLMGANDNGTFVASASGTLSLADFITTVKGWTLA